MPIKFVDKVEPELRSKIRRHEDDFDLVKPAKKIFRNTETVKAEVKPEPQSEIKLRKEDFVDFIKPAKTQKTHPTSQDSTKKTKPRKKKSKKEREENRSWSSKQNKKKKNNAKNDSLFLYNIRCDTRKEIKDESGKTIPVKTTVMVNQAVLENNNIDTFATAKSLKEKLKEIDTYRSPAKVTKASIAGSPLEIETPGGSKLNVRREAAGLYFADNIPAQKIQPVSIDPTLNFSQSKAYAAVKAPQTDKKICYETVTKMSLEQAAKEKLKNKGRGISQNKVMATGKESDASATKYAEAAGIKKRYEWLHLGPNFANGLVSQDERNLVGGPFGLNSKQAIDAEAQYNYLAENYPEFKVYHEATLKKDGDKPTQLAESIETTVITPDFSLKYTYDGDIADLPPIYMYHMNKNFVETIVNVKKSQKEKTQLAIQECETKKPVTQLPFNFFRKEDLAKVHQSDTKTSTVKKKLF